MKRKLLVSGILGVMLIFVMFLFLGCPTDNGDGNNDDTNDDRGFLEILYGESSGDSSTDEGVYVGIISFAGDATIITDPVFLNASGYNTLKSKITNNYTRASSGSTTMFLAVHKALAELKKNENTYPTKLDTVSIITFTDGLDNQSLAMLAHSSNQSGSNYQLEGKTYDTSDPESAGSYRDYIKGEIDGRKIKGHTIKAYAVGVKGTDVTDEASFDARLPKIASNGTDESGVPYVTKLTDFAELRGTFQSIANGLNVTHTRVNIVMTTTQNDTGTVYRWTFDNVNASTVGNSTKYIEATFTPSGSNYTLTNITYAGGISTAQGSGPLTGEKNAQNQVDFTFTDVSGYDPDTEGKPSQWIKAYGSTVWGPESEIASTGNADKSVEHKTAIIYLVLDASTSLSDANIASIKSAITSGSNGGNNSGNNQAPNAPTNVTAMVQSSSSIDIAWSSVSRASYYNVYRSSSAFGTYTWVGESYGTYYTDTGLSPNTTYYYKVTAVNSAEESSLSSSSYTYATTSSSSSGNSTASAPTGVTANTLSSSSIEVYWDSVGSYYEIYRSSSAFGTYTRVAESYGTSYTDTGLSPNTTYYYRVIAVYSAEVKSDFSSYASAKTQSSGGLGISDITYSSVSGGTWILQIDGSRKSPAINHGDVTKARVSFTSESYNTSITIQLTVSSEYDCDYAFISELDNASASYESGYYKDSDISGENTVTIIIPVSSPGRHFIDIGYRKDGSVSDYDDCAWFTVIHSQ
jgi:hypothetical protein